MTFKHHNLFSSIAIPHPDDFIRGGGRDVSHVRVSRREERGLRAARKRRTAYTGQAERDEVRQSLAMGGDNTLTALSELLVLQTSDS